MKHSTIRLLDHGVLRPVSAILRGLQANRFANMQVTRPTISLANLPHQADGTRLLQISDLHLRKGDEDIAEAVAELAHIERPDLIVYTGDFLDGDDGMPAVERLLQAMSSYRGRSFAVLGNHDHWSLSWTQTPNNVTRLRCLLNEARIHLLENAAVQLRELGIYLAGVDDPVTGRHDLSATFRDIPADSCVFLLSHSPEIVNSLGYPIPDLTLSGHTHGGQVRIPGLGPLIKLPHLPRSMLMGEHTRKGARFYVTRGLGCSGLDFRFRCPPELPCITLRAGSNTRSEVAP